MRTILMAGLCLSLMGAEVPTPEEMDRLREMVAAGVMPRKALEDAEARLRETEDEAFLKRTLFGHVTVQQLTEDQSRQMVAAADRQLERARRRLTDKQVVVDAGGAARLSLTPLIEEVDQARRTLDLAVHRARLFEELMLAARLEAEETLRAEELAAESERERLNPRYEGRGVLLSSHLDVLRGAFRREFSRDLPVSAEGETAFHLSMGFDHRGRVDVALSPDSAEGQWLLRYLESWQVPYIAFRGAVQGASSGAHIHIGPPSPRFRRTGQRGQVERQTQSSD